MRTKKLSGLVTLSFVLAFILAGCGENTTQANPVEASPPPRVITAEDWKKALDGAYTIEGEKKTDEDGIISYSAEFPYVSKSNGKTYSNEVKVKRDPFARWHTFTDRTVAYLLNTATLLDKSELSSLVYLKDCESPQVRLIAVSTSDPMNPLFIRKVAVMADGEIVFDGEVPSSAVTRQKKSGRFIEIVEAPVTDVEKMRKIYGSKQIIVRLTGDREYVTVPAKESASFQRAMKQTLNIYDALHAALKDNIPAKCS